MIFFFKNSKDLCYFRTATTAPILSTATGNSSNNYPVDKIRKSVITEQYRR